MFIRLGIKYLNMKEETKNWLKQAKEDYDVAEFNFKGKKYKAAAFYSQQAA